MQRPESSSLVLSANPAIQQSAGATRGEGRSVAGWAGLSPEGGDEDAAFVGLMAVVRQVVGHEASLL